jgi:hypothetical protein
MAKRTATAEPKVAKPKVIRRLKDEDVQEWFRTPDRFLKFLKRLPPGKLIEHPTLHAQPESAVVPTPYCAFWVAMGWFLRDAQGFSKDQEPDNVLGAIASHYYGPEPPTKLQAIFLHIEKNWIFRVWDLFDNGSYRRRLQVAELARVVQEAADGVEDLQR